jgi:hypothetical protein
LYGVDVTRGVGDGERGSISGSYLNEIKAAGDNGERKY